MPACLRPVCRHCYDERFPEWTTRANSCWRRLVSESQFWFSPKSWTARGQLATLGAWRRNWLIVPVPMEHMQQKSTRRFWEP